MSKLGLIKTTTQQREMRRLPRFPYSSLTFKSYRPEEKKVFEVKDISFSGMHLFLRDGKHTLSQGNPIQGILHWHGQEVRIHGEVQMATTDSLQIRFQEDTEQAHELKRFFSLEKVAKELRPLHREEFGLELPADLKYWLRTDGPVEIFIWQHRAGEYSRVQMILWEDFVEWEDGPGMRTGKMVSSRSIETPLNEEDQFYFDFDAEVDFRKVHVALDLIRHLPTDLLSQNAVDFLKMKLA